jgi:hypothetical protein
MKHHSSHHHSSHHHSRSPHVQHFLGHGHTSNHNGGAHHAKHAHVLMHGHHRSHHYNGGISGHPGHYDQGGAVPDETTGPKPVQGLRKGGRAHFINNSCDSFNYASNHGGHHKKHRHHHAMGGAGKVRKGMMTASGRILD